MIGVRTCGIAALSVLALTGRLDAAIDNVQIVATTATQAIISYEPSSTQPCAIQVSESRTLSPLVHDVDPQLFPGSNLDSRIGNTQNGRVRTFVVGRHGMSYTGSTNPFRASNGMVYSRALQTATAHYYRLTCGSDVFNGTFTTAVTPLGKTFSEPIPTGEPGHYNFPTLINDRKQTIVDPSTGVLLRRVTLDGDESTGQRISWLSGGSMVACSPVKRDGGYLCQVVQEPDGYQNLLYWINAASGEARYLGEVVIPGVGGSDGWFQASVREPVLWDRTDPNVFYHMWEGSRSSDASGYFTLLVKITYTGNLDEVAPRTWAALSAVNLTKPSEGRALEQLVQRFDSRYNPALFSSFGGVARQGDHILFTSRRHNQDSYGFLGVYDLPSNSVIALADVGTSSTTRWCGIHGLGTGPDVPVFSWGAQNLRGDGSTGPWQSLLTEAILSPSQTQIAVSGDPTCTNPTASQCKGASSDSDRFFQNAAPGDLFRIGDEWIRLAAKSGLTVWTVERGVFGSTRGVHPAGSYLRAMCGATANASGQFLSGFWSYLEDPKGTDTTNQRFILSDSMVGGHNFAMGDYWVMADYMVISGALPGAASKPIAYKLSSEPPFAGVSAPAGGNSYQKHPSYHNYGAGSLDKTSWFLDYQPFIGGNLHSANPGLMPVTGNLYRYIADPSHPVRPRLFDIFGTSFKFPLKNVSGPSVQLTGGAADSFKFCVVERDGECYTGSRSGDVFVNAPQVELTACSGGESTTTIRDVCIGNTAMYGQAVAQYGLTPGNVLSTGPPPTYGARWSRVLVSLTAEYRSVTTYAAAKSFADASWVMFPTAWDSANPNQHVMVAKLPPYPTEPPAADLSNFQNVPIKIADPSSTHSGTSNVVITFGYAENGPPDAFMCTQRTESCVKGSSPTVPYAYASEPDPGVPCSSGCTVSIPIVPDRIAYYRVTYRSSSLQTIGVGPIQVVASGRAPGASALPAPPTSVGVVR
jgi:hypothetical protein